MSDWIKGITRAQWVVTASLAVIMFVWLWIALSFWGQYRSLHQQSHDLIPRIARLSGLAESEAVLKMASEQANGQLQLLVYGEVGDASAMMQQQVRELMERSGLIVAGSQILAPVVEPLFTRLQLEVNATGSIDALEVVLQQLQDLKPLVMVDFLTAQTAASRVRRGEITSDPQILVLRLRFSSLKIQP